LTSLGAAHQLFGGFGSGLGVRTNECSFQIYPTSPEFLWFLVIYNFFLNFVHVHIWVTVRLSLIAEDVHGFSRGSRSVGLSAGLLVRYFIFPRDAHRYRSQPFLLSASYDTARYFFIPTSRPSTARAGSVRRPAGRPVAAAGDANSRRRPGWSSLAADEALADRRVRRAVPGGRDIAPRKTRSFGRRGGDFISYDVFVQHERRLIQRARRQSHSIYRLLALYDANLPPPARVIVIAGDEISAMHNTPMSQRLQICAIYSDLDRSLLDVDRMYQT